MPPLLRRGRRLRVRIGNVDKVPDGHLLEWDHLGLLGKLVAEIQDEDDGDVDIRRDERLCRPVAVDKGSVAAGYQQEGEEGERCPRKIGLERAFPRELAAVDSLGFAAIEEAEVHDTDYRPGLNVSKNVSHHKILSLYR